MEAMNRSLDAGTGRRNGEGEGQHNRDVKEECRSD